MITTQVGILTVLSIAVALVTLIGQNGNTSADVRVYYSESLTVPLVSSSVALLLVLTVQVIWPVQDLFSLVGLPSSTLSIPIIFTIIHLLWLCLNLAAFAHFAIVSLSFGNTLAWAGYRRRYTANQVVPASLQADLEKIHYANLGNTTLSSIGEDQVRRLIFSTWTMEMDAVEIATNFPEGQYKLYDVWRRPLAFALRSWSRRINSSQHHDNKNVFLAFNIEMGQEVSAGHPMCRRRGGLPLSRMERVLIQKSFRFKKVR